MSDIRLESLWAGLKPAPTRLFSYKVGMNINNELRMHNMQYLQMSGAVLDKTI